MLSENAEATKIVILHTNDTHAGVMEAATMGWDFVKPPAARVKAIKEENST